MRAVLQRVSEAAVKIDGELVSEIKKGLLILFGAEVGDTETDFAYTLKKCVNMRIFEDDAGKMNRSLADVSGEALIVSQFTLLADIRHGNRPGFTLAMEPKSASELYDRFCREFEAASGRPVKKGVFGADMKVSLINEGPVTIIVDSRGN